MAFFVSFYSYKGGVGRTLALANVAHSLAQRGKRVALVDLDLEAPALLGFPELALRGRSPKKGFLEFAAAYAKRGECPPIKDYIHACRRSPGTGQLWVMPGGRVDATYQELLGSLSWTCLHPFKGTPPFAEGLRRALIEALDPHYVLVDSRTGLSDIGGFSTHLLADMVVLVFNLTRECIEGSIRAYRSFEQAPARVRAVQLVASPVPPVVPSSDSLIETRIRQAREQMPRGRFFSQDVIRVAYDPAMALAQELAVLRPERYAAAERYEDLRKAIQRSNEDEIFPVVEEARRRRSEGRWEEGLRMLQEFVERQSQNPEGHLEMGSYLLEAGRVVEARACFKNAVNMADDLPLAHRKLGEALMAAGEVDAAVASFEKAQELGDESQSILDSLATAYSRQGTVYGERGDVSRQLEAQRKALEYQKRALEATAASGMTGKTRHVVDLQVRESGHLPADLEIRITYEDRRLTFLLHSVVGKVGFTHYRISGEIERRPLDEYRSWLFRTITDLGRGLATNGTALTRAEVARELEALGNNLYNELFPTEMKSAYREFRDRIRTILIVSDEAWIPWELIKPYDDMNKDDVFDDDFMCCRFELTRWLSGRTAPKLELEARRIASVVTDSWQQGVNDFNLSHAVDEGRTLTEFARQHPGIEITNLLNASREEIVDLLGRGDHGVVHFVGHGEFNLESPDTSSLLLNDGRALRPLDLRGPISLRTRATRPLIVLNSCQSGQQDYSLTGLGGWASRWILDCGCGAFVGPHWNIDDRSAYLFTKTFYEALAGGETIAAAVRQSRLRVREESPGNTAWLAYTVYAHPNARLRLRG